MQRPFPAQARRVLPRGITLAQLAITAALIAQPQLALAGQGGSNNSQGSGAGSKNESEMTTLVLGVATIFTAAGATYGSYRLSSKASPRAKSQRSTCGAMRLRCAKTSALAGVRSSASWWPPCPWRPLSAPRTSKTCWRTAASCWDGLSLPS